MKFIDEVEIERKRVLLRVDFNVPLKDNGEIADDARIRETLHTIKYLLKHENKVIIISHLGRPERWEKLYSLKKVARRLDKYIEGRKGYFVENFISDNSILKKQTWGEFAVLENIRFYQEETTNDIKFSERLAMLGDVYVNDAFAVSHRVCDSIIGITKFLPSYGGLLLKKETQALDKIAVKPRRPYVAILGGKKISTKLKFIGKLTREADYLLLSGGIANTFLAARGIHLGKSLYKKEELGQANKLTNIARRNGSKIILPEDAIVGTSPYGKDSYSRLIKQIKDNEQILDIGPKTQAVFESIIAKAKTIVWNGPVGFYENPLFRRGTEFVYYAIEANKGVTSIIGGGDTISAIANLPNLELITHISTGGGAMLAYIEHGTLPGIDALS